MELLKFEGETLMDDGGIVRRIKIKGGGFLNPNDGAWVNGKSTDPVKSSRSEASVTNVGLDWLTVHLEGTCGGRLFDSREVSFIVGEAEDKAVPFGVDRAMDKMQKGECCILHLKPK